MTAYEAGQLVAFLVFLLLGIALLVAGFLRRRRYQAAEAAARSQAWPAPADEAAALEPAAAPATWTTPVAPPKKRDGVGLMVAGGILVVLAVAGQLQDGLLSKQVERELALPTTLLGLEKDDALSQQVAAQLVSALPEGLDESDAALYGTPPEVLLVIAAVGDVDDPDEELESVREGFSSTSGSDLGGGEEVDAGDLGGEARCWSTELQGLPAVLCAFIDGGSIVTVLDTTTTDLDDAADRALQAREASVS